MYLQITNALRQKASKDTSGYIEHFDGRCREDLVDPMTKQIEEDGGEDCYIAETLTGPFHLDPYGAGYEFDNELKAREYGFHAYTTFESVDLIDREKNLVAFENSCGEHYYIVEGAKRMWLEGDILVLEKGEKTRWGVGFCNDRAIEDWKDSLEYKGNPPLRRRNAVGKDYLRAKADLEKYGDATRLVELEAEKKNLQRCKEEAEEEAEEAAAKKRRKEEKDLDIGRLNRKPVYVSARATNEDGTKNDEEMKLYEIRIVDFASGPFRHSSVEAKGEYEHTSINPSRVFVEANEGVITSSKRTRDYVLARHPQVFDDDGALSALMAKRKMFSEEDKRKLDSLAPAFGFMDQGNVMCRSAQNIVVNPFVLEEDVEERPLKRRRREGEGPDEA